ncbi:MAG: RagB/SusD family protein, partial [Prevotellaceae bacterium]|nr:RagB/SusD family protein [Prevotellaceae bacterium]
RKEFFQEGLRWIDIRRFHLSVRRSSKSRYYFPLEKEDPRKLLQIPTQAIERGLRPNPRERNAPQR